MENSSSIVANIRDAAVLRFVVVVGNPYLPGGLLIGSSLLGLIIIIGAFWCNRSNLSLFKRSCSMTFSCQENSLMGVQVVHNSLMSLLIVDAVNLIMAIILGAEMFGRLCYGGLSCLYIVLAWFLSRWFGVIIHLLNASLSISYLCQPQNVTRVRSNDIVIGLVIGITVPLYLYVLPVAIFVMAAFMFLFALNVIVKSLSRTSSPSTATVKTWIVVVAMCNFLVVYVPAFILECLLVSSANYFEMIYYVIIYVNVVVFTNLHLILSGLQCALVLKLPSGEEQPPHRQQQQWQQQELQHWQQPEQQQWQQQQWQQPKQQHWQQQQLGV